MAQQSKGDAAGFLDGQRLRLSEIRTDSVRHSDAHAAILVFSWDSVQPQSVLNRRARLLNEIEHVRRHLPRGNAGVKLEVEASNRCRIPGSYELNFIATATLPDGGSRRFLACRGKRYDLPQLGEALREVGWEPVRVLPFGPEPQRCALLLLRRL